jgi:hypothetical protein
MSLAILFRSFGLLLQNKIIWLSNISILITCIQSCCIYLTIRYVQIYQILSLYSCFTCYQIRLIMPYFLILKLHVYSKFDKLYVIKTYISNLVRTTRFWNNIHKFEHILLSNIYNRIEYKLSEEFDDTKGVIRICISKKTH